MEKGMGRRGEMGKGRRTGNFALTSASALPDVPAETENSLYVCTERTPARLSTGAERVDVVRERRIVMEAEKRILGVCGKEWMVGMKMME
jgi:hypothetical protein